MKNYFICKCTILITPLGLFVIENFNNFKLLTFFQKYRKACEHAQRLVLIKDLENRTTLQCQLLFQKTQLHPQTNNTPYTCRYFIIKKCNNPKL